jgi:phosphate uptake regulator
MLCDSLETLTERDVERAYSVGRREDAVDELRDIYQDLVRITIKTLPWWMPAPSDLLLWAHTIGRIADRATDIAKRVVFAVTGALPEMQVSSC